MKLDCCLDKAGAEVLHRLVELVGGTQEVTGQDFSIDSKREELDPANTSILLQGNLKTDLPKQSLL